MLARSKNVYLYWVAMLGRSKNVYLYWVAMLARSKNVYLHWVAMLARLKNINVLDCYTCNIKKHRHIIYIIKTYGKASVLFFVFFLLYKQ